MSQPPPSGQPSAGVTANIQNSKQNVWFITGTSSGLGYALVEHILTNPSSSNTKDLVIATSTRRSLHLLQPLTASYPDRLRVVELDITSPEETIRACAQQAIEVWGRVDVLVNNAGCGLGGTLEQSGISALLECYETNVLGPVKVTNAFLPHMRARGEGMIVFIGSRSAWRALPLTGIYSSAKAALHAIVDTYAGELRPFGIKVLGVQPGAFRTNTIRLAEYDRKLGIDEAFQVEENTSPSAKMLLSPRHFLPASPSYPQIEGYNPLTEGAAAFLVARAGKEPGDPRKAATAIEDVVRGTGPASYLPFPKWLALGPDCVADIRQKCDEVLKGLNAWEEVSCATDFD